jgi:hypothetical protein
LNVVHGGSETLQLLTRLAGTLELHLEFVQNMVERQSLGAGAGLALAQTTETTELGVVATQRALLSARDSLGLLGCVLLMLVLLLSKQGLLLVLQMSVVFPGSSLCIFRGQHDKDTGSDLVVDNGLVVLADNIDTEFDNIFRLELTGLGLDRLGRQTVAIDKCAVG